MTQFSFPISKIKFGKFECNKINNFCDNKWLRRLDVMAIIQLVIEIGKIKNLLIVVNLRLLVMTFTPLLKENV